MNLNNIKYNIGEIIYLKTDPTQSERFVTGIDIRETGITYRLMSGTEESWHYAFEMTTEKDLLKTLK